MLTPIISGIMKNQPKIANNGDANIALLPLIYPNKTAVPKMCINRIIAMN